MVFFIQFFVNEGPAYVRGDVYSLVSRIVFKTMGNDEATKFYWVFIPVHVIALTDDACSEVIYQYVVPCDCSCNDNYIFYQ